MKSVYVDTAALEAAAKEKFAFPEMVMMENAAAALEHALDGIAAAEKAEAFALILCGSGGNGGDGLALARRIQGRIACTVCLFQEPKTPEAKAQKRMAERAGVRFDVFSADFFDALISDRSHTVIAVDCLFGSGFHGALPPDAADAISHINASDCRVIACDIPSGVCKDGSIATRDANGFPLAFRADCTVTMGALKTALYSDGAKDFTGTVVCAPLGVSERLFLGSAVPDALLLEISDMRLPIRTQKSAHKGAFGHAVIISGEKSGAAVIAARAALQFGSGLVSVVESGLSESRTELPCSLMSADCIPEAADAALVGSGLGRSENAMHYIEETVLPFIMRMPNKTCVLDADIFYYKNLPSVLRALCEDECARVILTPHPKELSSLLALCGLTEFDAVKQRFDAVRAFSLRFPQLTLVAKGAVTYIASGGTTYIADCGSSALAKAGSGDVLAGLCTALLAQGWRPDAAAKTAVLAHALAGAAHKTNYALTPLSLIEEISRLPERYGISSV